MTHTVFCKMDHSRGKRMCKKRILILVLLFLPLLICTTTITHAQKIQKTIQEIPSETIFIRDKQRSIFTAILSPTQPGIGFSSSPILYTLPFSELEQQQFYDFYKSQGWEPVWISPDMQIVPTLHNILNYLPQHAIAVTPFSKRISHIIHTHRIPSHMQDLTLLEKRILADVKITRILSEIIHGIRHGFARKQLQNPDIVFSDYHSTPVPALNHLANLAHTNYQNHLIGFDPFAAIAPSNKDYINLQTAFKQALHTTAQPALNLQTNLTPGMQTAEIPLLREFLERSGDYNSPTIAAEYDFFDASLKQAVIRFQKRNGIYQTGNVGPQTRKALRISRQDILKQMALNLERIRWYSHIKHKNRIVVNIPDFSLYFYQNNYLLRTMPVVVGRLDRQTPQFDEIIRYIEFNPHWHVPHKLAVQDLLPKFSRDPSYIKRHRYQILHNGKRISAENIDWQKYIGNNRFPFRLRQAPGPSNSLGKVKFMFPNKMSIYLHDTPQKKLFHRHKRYQSSGCIRVSDPLWLAEKLLDTQLERSTTKELFRSRNNKRIYLQNDIPIILTYLTSWINEEGILQRRPDIYQQNTKLLRALKEVLFF